MYWAVTYVEWRCDCGVHCESRAAWRSHARSAHGRRPRILDLFCGGGGAGMGYHRAGFDVVGVDLVPQRQYPFEFHLGSATTFPVDGFDAIHASPPCQAFTSADSLNPATSGRLFSPHVDLIEPTRSKLLASGLPWVMENVPGAPLRDPIRLCGTGFGLEVIRHRNFEMGGWAPADPAPECSGCRGAIRDGRAISVFGHGGGRMDGNRGMRGRFDGLSVVESFQRAMGIDWLTDTHRLAEAIPPAYTEWIGRQLMAHLEVAA